MSESSPTPPAGAPWPEGSGLASHSVRAPRLFVIALLLLAVAQVYRLTAPTHDGPFRLGFLGHNAARYSLAGRNYLRHGFVSNAAAPDLTPDRGDAAHPRHLYLHHPPLAPWLVGASFQASGESEAAAVRPFLWLGLLAPVLVFLVGRRMLTGAGAGVAALLFASVPMTGVYGAHVDPQGPATTVGVLAAVAAWLRYRESGRRVDWLLALLVFAAALLTDWPVVLLALLVPVAGRLFPAAGPRDSLGPPVVATALVLAFLAWIVAIGRDPREALLSSAGSRSWSFLASGDGLALLIEFGRRLVEMLTVPLLAFAALAAVPWMRRRAARSGAAGAGWLLLLGAGGLHVVLFPAGAVIHEYWAYLLVAPIALAAAAAVENLRVRAARAYGVGFSLVVALAPCALVGYAGDQTTRSRFDVMEQEARLLPHARLGQYFRERVRPGERALTNLPYNPVRSDMLMYPAFTYYADRVVRGGVQTEEDLDRAIAEEGAFDRFVYVPLGPDGAPVAGALFERDPEHFQQEVEFTPGVKARVFVFDLRR